MNFERIFFDANAANAETAADNVIRDILVYVEGIAMSAAFEQAWPVNKVVIRYCAR